MKLAELKTILANHVANLSGQRAEAVIIGDLARVSAIDLKIAETESTLAQLNSL